MTFRGCRYEVYVSSPNKRLWSRHFSLKEARKSFTEAVNNRRGDHSVGAIVEFHDVNGELRDEQQKARHP